MKLIPWNTRCILVDFNNTRKGCRLFDFWTKKRMILKDAIVDESMHGL
jgi:hypothetical protein